MMHDLMRRTSFAEVRYGSGRRMLPHAHSTTSISLVLSGGLDEDALGKTWESRALSVVVKPGGVVHEDRFGGDGALMLSLVFPRRASSWAGSYEWFHGGPVARCALDVLRARRDGGGDPAVAIERLLAAVATSRRPGVAAPWLTDARVALLGGETVGRVARRLRVHPGSLSRAYRRTFGLTPLADRARERVRRAADRIGSTSYDLAAIAAETGFSDQAHLTRTFKRETGTTPAAYRALVTA